MLEALHADRGTGMGKTKCGGVKGRLVRLVPVTDCIAMTGTLVMVDGGGVGCGGWGGWRWQQKGVGVEDDRGCREGFVKKSAGVDKTRKED